MYTRIVQGIWDHSIGGLRSLPFRVKGLESSTVSSMVQSGQAPGAASFLAKNNLGRCFRKGFHVSYGLNLGCGGHIGDYIGFWGENLLRGILQI